MADAQSRLVQAATHWQRFSVPYEFPVVFTEGVFDPENPALRDVLCRLEPSKRHRVVVFLDDALSSHVPAIHAYAERHRDVMELACPPVAMPGGEKVKTDLHFVESAQQKLFDLHIDRHSFVIAVGGGALLDAIGLVAGTTHRGVRHVRIPTTVLAQNDSGVGVKNGVNLHGVKNFVGTFAPPFAVLNDLRFILTLPERDKVAGMAEAFNLPVVSHLIPEVHVHLIGAVPNGLTVEYMPWSFPLFRWVPPAVHGEIELPQTPGGPPSPTGRRLRRVPAGVDHRRARRLGRACS